MMILGFLLGVTLTISFIIYLKYNKFKKHYNNLLWNKTKEKIKINKTNLVFMLIGEDYTILPKIIEIGLTLLLLTIIVNTGIIKFDEEALNLTFIIVSTVIIIINTYILISIIIKKRNLFKNDYYYIEDKVTYEQTDVVRIDNEFYVHFEKCVVPTEIPVHIADAIIVGSEVYLLVMGKEIHVYNKEYFELEEKDKLKDKYEITTSIEGK